MRNGPFCHAGTATVFAAAREDPRLARAIVVCNAWCGALPARRVAA